MQPLLSAKNRSSLESHESSTAATTAHAALDGSSVVVPMEDAGTTPENTPPASQYSADNGPLHGMQSPGSSNVLLMGELPPLYSTASWAGPQRPKRAPVGPRVFRKSATLVAERLGPERRVLQSPFAAEAGSTAAHGSRFEWDPALLKRKLVCP
jgi:hypothetical protein